jgi:hypothetical protein
VIGEIAEYFFELSAGILKSAPKDTRRPVSNSSAILRSAKGITVVMPLPVYLRRSPVHARDTW